MEKTVTVIRIQFRDHEQVYLFKPLNENKLTICKMHAHVCKSRISMK